MSKNLSVKYYQDNLERLLNKTRESFENFSREQKENKKQYGCE